MAIVAACRVEPLPGEPISPPDEPDTTSVAPPDEPSGNLDSGNGAMIADLLFNANAERGMTLVLVTHDATLAARSGRVVRLNSGRVVEEETITEEDEAALARSAEDVRLGRFASNESVKAIFDRYRETPAS